MKQGCTIESDPLVLAIPSQDDIQLAAETAVTAFSALISSDVGGGPQAGLVSNWAALTEVRAASVGNDSHRPSNRNTVIIDLPTPVRGVAPTTGGSNVQGQIPYQVAVVATFRGDLYTRGIAAYGRFYLPVPNIVSDPAGTSQTQLVDGLMAAGTVTKFANAFALFLKTMHVTELGANVFQRPVNVGSSTTQSLVRWQDITAVSVDNRPDTVRRRSNAISGQGEVRVSAEP